MRLDVFLTPGEVVPGEVAGRTVVVLDVLRATTTIVEALSSGAKAIYPVASIDDALRLATTLGRGDVVLCGERRCLPIEGFDLGNSPGDFTPDRVRGKTLVMSTTNGTQVMSMLHGASRVLIGALVNLEAVVGDLAASQAEPVFICAGRERFFALEDAVCAGAMASRLMRVLPGDWQLNDGAIAAVALGERFGVTPDLLTRVGAGRQLAEAGLAEDLATSAQVNRHTVVPVLHDRHITLAAPPADRVD